MRKSQQCLKCDGRKFIVNSEMRQPDWDSNNVTAPFCVLAAGRDFPGTDAVTGATTNSDRAHMGRFESWICMGCGYTELYATDLEDVVRFAHRYPSLVRIHDAEPPTAGPFR
jgi:predicted nucleic-acid-binding Zn-ribbon protein